MFNGLFSKIAGNKLPTVPAQVLILPNTISVVRKGMWVVYKNGQTGIIRSVGPQGAVDVMLVDSEKGENDKPVMAHIAELRQARFSEIPRARRENRPVHHFHRLGYKD